MGSVENLGKSSSAQSVFPHAHHVLQVVLLVQGRVTVFCKDSTGLRVIRRYRALRAHEVNK